MKRGVYFKLPLAGSLQKAAHCDFAGERARRGCRFRRRVFAPLRLIPSPAKKRQRTGALHANCPNRPSQNEYRKRAVPVRNGECGVRSAPQFDFLHRQASCASPCEIMPRAKASHCLRRISQGEPARPVAPAECGVRRARTRPSHLRLRSVRFGVAAFGRKPPSKIPAQFAALCRDAATSARFPCTFDSPVNFSGHSPGATRRAVSGAARRGSSSRSARRWLRWPRAS